MVNGKSQNGQSTLEFLLILGALTFLGAYLGWKMLPTGSNTGALMNVQTNAEKKIGND